MAINRILIVGLGSIGQRHLHYARDLLPKADIRVLRHQVGSTVPGAANGGFYRIDEAIAFAPQIAVIANPAPFHIATAQAFAEVGVHLLIEKPLSVSLDGVTQLLETCHKHGTAVLTGYNLRFLPSLQRFRALLGDRVIGKVISLRCEVGQYLPSWRPDSDYRQSVSAKRVLGGGVLLELSHEVDYLRWIFGEVDWVRSTLSRQSSLALDVEDAAHLTLGFAPAVDGRQLIGVANLDFIRHDTTRLCTAVGESGSLRWNGLAGAVELYEAGGNEWRLLFNHPDERDDSYLAEWRNLMDCVNELGTPMVSGADGLRALQIIEAARISAESGSQVPIAAVVPGGNP